MALKLTWFFVAGRYGWTESLYTPLTDYDIAANLGQFYALRRRNLMNTDSYLTNLRVSDPSIFRDAVVTNYTGTANTVGLFPSVQPLPPYTSILMSLRAGTGSQRQLYLRGLPAEADPDPNYDEQVFNPTPGFLEQATDFSNWLLAQGFSIQHYQAANPGVVFSNAVPNTANARYLNVTFFQAPAVDALIRIVGAGGFNRPINGVWKVISVAGTVGTLYRAAQAPLTGTWNGKGTQQTVVVSYRTITRASYVRIVKRNTGGPFDRPRGRTKART